MRCPALPRPCPAAPRRPAEARRDPPRGSAPAAPRRWARPCPPPGRGAPRPPGRTRPPRSRPVLDDRPTAPVPQARPNGVPRTKRAVVDERSRAAAQRPPVQRPPVRYHGPTPEELRLDAAGRSHARRFSTLGPALLTTLLSTLVPGAGHLALRRYRTGAAIMAAFVLGLLTLLVLTLRADRSDLIGTLLSSRTLVGGAIGLLVAALAWMAVIVRTYLLARPTGLRTGQRLLGAGAVAVLCLTVAAPLGFGAELANSQRQLLERLFPSLERRHPRRGGDRQGAAERAAGRQRRRAGPARHPDGHDDGRERGHAHRPHDPLRAPPQPAARAVPAGIADGPGVPPGLPQPLGPAVRRLPAQRRLRLRPQLPAGRARRAHHRPGAEPAALDGRDHAGPEARLLRRGEHGRLRRDHRRAGRPERGRRPGAAARSAGSRPPGGT